MTHTVFLYTSDEDSFDVLSARIENADELSKIVSAGLDSTVGEVIDLLGADAIVSYEFASQDERTGDYTANWLDTFAPADDPRKVTKIEVYDKNAGCSLWYRK